MKTWYAVNLLFKAVHAPEDREREPLWEESIRVYLADSEAEAWAAAEQAGKDSEVFYETTNGTVRWTYQQIERVYEIGSSAIDSGTEVFSRHLRDLEVESMLAPFGD